MASDGFTQSDDAPMGDSSRPRERGPLEAFADMPSDIMAQVSSLLLERDHREPILFFRSAPTSRPPPSSSSLVRRRSSDRSSSPAP
jgi:hypothetical protein